MRILLLSNTPFLPPAAGNRERIRQMVEHLLGHGAEVAMLMLPEVDRPTWDEPGMRSRLAHFEVVRPSLARRARRRVAGALGRFVASGRHDPTRPIGIDEWCPTWFRECAARFASEWRPDVVVVEYVFLSACLDDVRRSAPGALAVIDTLDVFHRRRETYDAAGLAPRWFHTTYEEERRGLARADLILAMGEGEAETLRRMAPERTVLVVPHGRSVRPAPLHRAEPNRLLYVASCNDLNVQGLRWLLEHVWPGLRVAFPAVELTVCGTIGEKLREVPPGVHVRGFVAALEEDYARARIVVNPVPSTTGLQVKTVEALCHGRPVVSTRAGAAGVEDARGVLVADTAAEFGRAIGRLLHDDALWSRLAGEATAYARRRFSPDAAFAPLTERLARATLRRAGG